MKTTIQSLLALLAVSTASAVPFTETSPTSQGALPAGVTTVGGIVLDAVGTNGARLVAQLAASTLFLGNPAGSPIVIGTQSGLSAALLAQLGGGFSELAIRVTLYDGDTAAGNFDFNNNSFLLNGINIGNWSSVNAQTTNSTGTVGGSFSGGGFRDDTLDTGWFNVTNGATLTGIYNSVVATNTLIYGWSDTDPNDQFLDFKRGVEGGLINSGQAPIVTPPTVPGVPDSGATLAMLGLAFTGIAGLRRKFGV